MYPSSIYDKRQSNIDVNSNLITNSVKFLLSNRLVFFAVFAVLYIGEEKRIIRNV